MGASPGDRRHDGGTPEHPPARLPQRWVVILAVAGVTGAVLAARVDPVTGLTAGLAIVGLLHTVMD
ncbi:hypothetical protein SAMN04489712_103409 [Thermomonospora echinospora]|uniref:Uncharacterized protein n=1 Tax=Thermomonospora echinospora TaxID=1992 RepID=A0A1H5XV02_9ACTN|nr:hypothetical protein [Thermomonospora echinospora]SEG15220.1 hypothetical protein SAMN04489712_103409 [Thermomonospora echinospora]